MNTKLLVLCVLVFVLFIQYTKGDSYDDVRCICICPNISVVNATNTSQSNRLYYIGNGPRTKCNCDGVVLPRIEGDLRGKEEEFCLRCDCKYESRNTTIIKVVVIFVIWILSLLCIYMLFLMCLDPFLTRRSGKGSYQEHTNEDDESLGTSIPSTSQSSNTLGDRSNVLRHVGNPQDKWKKHLRQVEEQRKHIYDQHTMLN